jgi:hypothetical protein
MSRPKPYRVSYPHGGCTVVYAASEAAASRRGKRIFDRHSEPEVREATKDDIDWVKGMGGRIHSEPTTRTHP